MSNDTAAFSTSTAPSVVPAPAAGPTPGAHAGPPPAFSSYQKFVVGMLAFLQFTIILDFMIISPLGAILLRDLHLPTQKFGLVVSVYAFSASLSGLLAAGFADRFDRKKLLLFFYAGFTAGTLFCGLAPTYQLLLAARIVTGVFGGVIGSISMAIITDLFPITMRGRVMGVVQTSFAASQVLGLPLGLYLANRWGWHAPFLMIVALTVVAGGLIFARLQPIDAHLKLQREGNPFVHLFRTVSQRRYLQTFATTTLLATGGFMREKIHTPPTAPKAAMAMNGTCQFQRVERYRPKGMPSTWLAAKAVWMNPITRPRICSANRSVAMAMTTEPMTPPNRPVTVRASSSVEKFCARPHHRVPSRKPVKKNSSNFLRSKRSAKPAVSRPETPAAKA